MATVSVSQSSGMQTPSAILRSGRVAAQQSRTQPTRKVEPPSLRRRSNIGTTRALSMMPAAQAAPEREDSALARNPLAQFNANRHRVQQFNNPSAGLPSLQAQASELEEGGDEEDVAASANLLSAGDDIAQEAEEQEDISSRALTQSRLRAQAEQGLQDLKKKSAKQLEKFMQKATREGAAKTASAADWGEAGEIVDSAGTGYSTANVVLSIFQDGMSDETKSMLERGGIVFLKPSEDGDVLIAAGTAMQLGKWFTIVGVFLPYLIILTVTTFTAIADQICSYVPFVNCGTVMNAFTSLL